MNESRSNIIDSAVSEAVQAQVDAIPLEDINVAQPELFRDNTMWPYFERLRNEDPVHYCKDSRFGPYWSVTKYKDIMTVEMDHKTYSSDTANGGITIEDDNLGLGVEMFIALDPPQTRRAAQSGQPDGFPGKPRPNGGDHPQPYP